MHELFLVDTLSKIMISFVIFIMIIIAVFSRRYMAGDSQYTHFYRKLSWLALSLIIFFCANNIILFIFSWVSANACLVSLIKHKKNWMQANYSGKLGSKAFFLASCFVGFGLIWLYFPVLKMNLTSLFEYNHYLHYAEIWKQIALFSIIIGVFIQSAAWPFERWLLSSANAPTPVCALMHAGLVNSGGFILTRLAPLFLQESILLTFIFIIGLVSAILGSIFKLIQTDIKRMLACSTMAQMGFMLVQCGLGLFPAAITHLCWHGLFKSYLFLSANNATKASRVAPRTKPNKNVFLIAFIMGSLGALTFSFCSSIIFNPWSTAYALIGLVWIVGTELIIAFLKENVIGFKTLFLSLIITVFMGVLYGFSIGFMEIWLHDFWQPQALNSIYIAGFLLFIMLWLSMHFIPTRFFSGRAYVFFLNASQPDPKTTTSHRTHYHF